MFDLILEPDDSPIDNTDITSVQLFYSTTELREYKELCKHGMIKMYGPDYDKGNISDFVLTVLRQYKERNP